MEQANGRGEKTLEGWREEINALGFRTTFGYTGWGARESLQDPLGNRTTWAWSSLGLLDAEVHPPFAATQRGDVK